MAHTTPIYVTVDGSGFHNPETVLCRLDLSEQYLDELEHAIVSPDELLSQQAAWPNETMNQHAWRYREGLEARIAETREIIAMLRTEFEIEFPPRR